MIVKLTKVLGVILRSSISVALICVDVPVVNSAPVVTFGFSTSATGTNPFTSGGGTNGNDQNETNNIVRTYDLITYAWDYGVNQEDVINGVFTATISADQEWVNLPPACKTGSDIVTNSDGTQTLTCNVGTITRASTGKLEANARILGKRRPPVNPPTNEFVGNNDQATATGTFNGDNIPLQTDDPVTTIISATPKADLRKPRANVEGLRKSRDGTEDGIVIRYPVNIRVGDGKGSEPLNPPGGTITITDDLSEMVPRAELYDWGTSNSDRGSCGWLGQETALRYSGFPWGKIDQGQPDEESVTDSGTWTCTQIAPGQDITIQIQDADTTGNRFPDKAFNGATLPADDRYLVSGVIRIWVPVQPINDAGGEIVTKNCLSELNEPGVSTQINQDPITPSNSNDSLNRNIPNNCYAFTLIAGRGSFNTYYARSLDRRGSVLFPMTAINSGDGVVMPTQNFVKRLFGRNNGALNWENYIFCEKFDNKTHQLEPIPGDPTTAVKVFNTSSLSAAEYVIEYGTGDYANFTEQRTATCEDADSPGGWITDLSTLPNTDNITKIRFRMLPGQVVEPNERMDLAVNFTARNLNPDTTAQIPSGTILSNNSTYHTDQLNNGNWRTGSYNPATHGGSKSLGDRLTLTRAITRINKETTPDDNEVTAISAGETISFKLIPTLTATVDPPPVSPVVKVIDRLPEYLSYVENSANIAPTTITNNSDNTTTLEWDLGTQTPNQPLPEITFDSQANLDAPNNVSAINTAIVESPDDASDESSRSDTRTVTIGNLAAFRIFKQTVESSIPQNDNITYYLNFANTGSSNLGIGEFIDILPHVNDGRTPTTNFDGNFEILSVSGDNGETFEYTVKNHADINPDPQDSSHKSFGESVSSGDTLWCNETQFGNSGCPTSLAQANAIRIFTPNFPQGTPTRRVTVLMDTENNQPQNAYTNEFSGRVDGLIGFLTSPAASVTVSTPAKLILVKRVTAINRGLDDEQLFDNVYVDDSDTKDNEPGWSVPIDSASGISEYLSGVENVQAKPGDVVEYTVYFLANGDFDVVNATICDVLLQNNDRGEFVADSFGRDRGITLQFGDKPVDANAPFDLILSNLTDSDQGEFILPGDDAPRACNSPIFGGDYSTNLPGNKNSSGSVVVNLPKISHLGNNSFGSTPAYGAIRFRIKID